MSLHNSNVAPSANISNIQTNQKDESFQTRYLSENNLLSPKALGEREAATSMLLTNENVEKFIADNTTLYNPGQFKGKQVRIDCDVLSGKSLGHLESYFIMQNYHKRECPKIVEFKYSGELGAIEASLPKLEYLDISGTKTIKNRDDIKLNYILNLSNLPKNLKTLVMKNTNIDKVGVVIRSQLGSLGSLDVSGNTVMNSDDLSDLLGSIKDLKTLAMGGMNIKSLPVFNIVKLKNLESLDISGYDAKRLHHLSFILKSLKNIETLKMQNVDFNGIKVGSVKKLSTLKHLDISNAQNLTSIHVYGLVNGAEDLKTLVMKGTNIDVLEPVIRAKLDSLKSLDISENTEMKSEDLSELLKSAKNIETLKMQNVDFNGIEVGYDVKLSTLKHLDVSDAKGLKSSHVYSLVNGAEGLETLVMNKDHYNLLGEPTKNMLSGFEGLVFDLK